MRTVTHSNGLTSYHSKMKGCPVLTFGETEHRLGSFYYATTKLGTIRPTQATGQTVYVTFRAFKDNGAKLHYVGKAASVAAAIKLSRTYAKGVK